MASRATGCRRRDGRIRGRQAAAAFLDRPVSAACILALFATYWLYPRTAVPLHGAALTLLLLPYFRFLPKLAHPAVIGPAYGLGAVFLLDRVHDFALPHSLLSRLVLLVIGCLGICVLGLGASERRWSRARGSLRVVDGLPHLVRIAIAFLAVAIVANRGRQRLAGRAADASSRSRGVRRGMSLHRRRGSWRASYVSARLRSWPRAERSWSYGTACCSSDGDAATIRARRRRTWIVFVLLDHADHRAVGPDDRLRC